MKGMCYIVLIVAFLMFYQREPIFTIFIIGIAAGLYLFFRSRKNSSRRRRSGFLSAITGRTDDQYERSIDDLITLMMLQELFSEKSSQPKNENLTTNNNSEHTKLKKIKEDILALLPEE
ncbi:MAG: hypothetical protein ACFFD1_12625 [Candidatus Thorarchaeota archaeon]